VNYPARVKSTNHRTRLQRRSLQPGTSLSRRWLLAMLAALGAVPAGLAAAPGDARPSRYRIVDDGIPTPLAAATGDVQRGRQVTLDANRGNCTVCHAMPINEVSTFGNVGPPLDGVGSRLTEPQLRLRIVDARRINRRSTMPPYHRVEGLHRVAHQYRGRPVLDAQEVEDVVAYLASLK
jgi:sulfur-oxidizing protein SoxX